MFGGSAMKDSSRRDFLKKTGVVGAAVVAGGLVESSLASTVPFNPRTERAMATRAARTRFHPAQSSADGITTPEDRTDRKAGSFLQTMGVVINGSIRIAWV